MKNYLFASLILLFTSCTSSNEPLVPQPVDATGTSKVTVRVSDFSVSMEEFATKSATPVVGYNGVKAITLAFYGSENYEQYKTTQLRADGSTYDTFGEFSCSLPIGTYTMVVMGYGSESAITLTSPVSASYGEGKVRETFCMTQTVTVTGTTPLDLSVALNRQVSKLEVVSTDNLTSGVSQMRVTFGAGGKSFSPATGLATSDTGFSVDIVPTQAVGTPLWMVAYLFLATDEETMDVTIQAFDAEDNLLFTKVVEDVTFKRNRVTKLTGSVFTASASAASFSVETDWLDPINVNF